MPRLSSGRHQRSLNVKLTAQQQVAHDVEHNGARLVSLARMESELARIGYRLDRNSDAVCDNLHLTGPLAGHSYPAVNLYVVEADTGIGAHNVKARRGDNHAALREMRSTLFAIVRGRVLGF